MEYTNILLPLSLIICLSQILVKLCEKFNLPRVVGMLLTGIIIGLFKFIPNQTLITPFSLEGLGFIAKIGVILIMFNVGLSTNLKNIKAIGGSAIAITIAGVVFPMILGFILACICRGGFNVSKNILISNIFYGVILTATSISVTVETLKEMGKIKGKVGNSIISAAILDDIIGIVALSIIIGLNGTGTNVEVPSIVILKTLLFFIFSIIAGFICRGLFISIENKISNRKMLHALGISLCFLFSYVSETWFGVADITGAFVAGIVLSSNHESNHIGKKLDIMSYMIFTPVFFANIGITTEFTKIDTNILLFGICFIIAGIAGKILGCSGMAKLCGYNTKDSLKIGIGMMARAEVALVCTQKGVENYIIDSSIMPFVVLLIIISSFVTPIILRKLYQDEIKNTKKYNIC